MRFVHHTLVIFLIASLTLSPQAQAKKNSHSSSNLVPPLSSESATCDLAFMDEFYNELRGGVCLSGSLLETECMKFSAAEAVTFAPFLFGMGRVIGLLGFGTSGASSIEGYLEEETAKQKIGRNRLAQTGVRCSEPFHRYMNTQLDHQVRAEEFERPLREDDDEEEESESTKPKSKSQIRAQAKRDLSWQRELSWWCAPYYAANNTAISPKNIAFLKLPEGKRRELLCAHPELRDYYQRLMEPYTERLRSKTKITGLKCDGASKFEFIVEHEGKPTIFDVKLSEQGNYSEVMSRPPNAEDSPAYVSWQKALKQAKARGDDYPESFKINNQPSSLVPGRFLFNFRDNSSGAQLTSINLINGPLTPMAPRLVSTLDAARLESVVRSMSKTYKNAELDSMARSYQLFNLRANEAKNCCKEENSSKKRACLQNFDQARLTPASELQLPASAPARLKPTLKPSGQR